VMRNRAAAPAVILLDQASFGGAHSARELARQLLTAGLTVHSVEKGQEFRAIPMEKREQEQQRRAQGVASDRAAMSIARKPG
jgi:hypothetical protein